MTELEKKKELLRLKSEAYLKQIELQSEELRVESKRWLKTAAITGGSALLTYWLIRKIGSKKTKRASINSSEAESGLPATYQPYPEFSVWREVKQQLTYTLIGLAKDKLVHYLSKSLKDKPSEPKDL
jgi:hypothetical protein